MFSPCLVMCMKVIVKQTMAKQRVTKQTTRLLLHSILVNLGTILVSILECPNSAGMKKLAGLPAKFYSTGFCWNDQNPTGIGGALIRPQMEKCIKAVLTAHGGHTPFSLCTFSNIIQYYLSQYLCR